jgi:diguanylate cyclase (GGDEF)-like protein/PAS domain S-box-containing protein
VAKETLTSENACEHPDNSATFAWDILNSLTAQIVVLDAHGVIITVNEAWKRFAQANNCSDRAFYVGTNYLAVCEDVIWCDHATAEATRNGVGAVLRGQQGSFSLEYPCHSPSKEGWFLIRVTRLSRDASSAVVVAHEDITARKRAEQQSRYHTQLLANVNDVIIGTDQNFTITFWNPAAEKIFGWTSHEVIGRQTADVLQTELSEIDRAESIRALAETGIWIGEVGQHARDGSRLVFEASIMALYENDGSITGYVSANRDITQRKHAETALHESEARFRNLTESLPDAVYILDLVNHNVAYFNHEAFLGYSRDELMGLGSILHGLHPEDTSAVMAHWQKVTRGEVPGSLEYRLRNKAGHWEWVASRETIVSRGADGAPKEIMVILSTITERKQAEEELRHAKEIIEAANRELQQAVAREQFLARTDELTRVNNRRHFFDLAKHEFAVAQRYQHPLSVILFDIDHFKQINDTFGHQVGDEVLHQIAQIAGAHLRAADVLARYGGEEFVLLLPDSTTQQARVLAERIRKGIAERGIDTDIGNVRVTMSAGIAEVLSQEDTLDRLIQRADQALYVAKEAGRNRTILFSPAILDQSSSPNQARKVEP